MTGTKSSLKLWETDPSSLSYEITSTDGFVSIPDIFKAIILISSVQMAKGASIVSFDGKGAPK